MSRLLSRQAQGFTLVEVLVALAILALSLPALMLTISTQINGLAQISDKTLAHWVAVNKMNELRLQNQYQQYLPRDSQEGQEQMQGRDWYWFLNTETTGQQNLLRVSIDVRLVNNPDAAALATVENFLPLPLAVE